MSINTMQVDANESAIFLRQLESIKTKTYDTKQKVLKGLSLIPISTAAQSGADVITYRQFTQVGYAKFISDYSKDFPRVDVYGVEVKRGIKSIGASYGYSIKELRRSQMAGTDLDTKRALAVRRANDELVNTTALIGSTDAGIPGFINNANVGVYTVPSDGTGSSQKWKDKTPQLILRDMNALVNFVVAATNGRETPDTLLLPIAQYNYIATTQVGTYNDKTILRFFLDNSPYIKTVDWLVELAGIGTSSADRMICYVRDEDHLTLEIPQPFEQLSPEIHNMEYTVGCHSETAGTIIYYPASIAIGDGINLS